MMTTEEFVAAVETKYPAEFAGVCRMAADGLMSISKRDLAAWSGTAEPGTG